MVVDKPHNEPVPPEENIRAQRPLGVNIIGGLMILANLGLLFWVVLRRNEIFSIPDGLSQRSTLFPVYVIAVIVLDLVIGAAFWMGKRWGWWAMVFRYFFKIFSVGIAIMGLTSTTITDRMMYDALIDGMGILLYLALISYLSENHVISFFGLDTSLKKRYLFYLAIGAMITAAVFALV